MDNGHTGIMQHTADIIYNTHAGGCQYFNGGLSILGLMLARPLDLYPALQFIGQPSFYGRGIILTGFGMYGKSMSSGDKAHYIIAGHRAAALCEFDGTAFDLIQHDPIVMDAAVHLLGQQGIGILLRGGRLLAVVLLIQLPDTGYELCQGNAAIADGSTKIFKSSTMVPLSDIICQQLIALLCTEAMLPLRYSMES